MTKKTKFIFFGISGLISLILILVGALFAIIHFTFPDLSSQFGTKTIFVGGKQVYFRREARGLNFDDTILSPNKDVCAEYNSETDFHFPGMDDVIYYKINGEVLELISPPTIQPKNFPVKVEVHEVKDPLEWFRLKDTHKKKALSCWIFRSMTK